MSIVSATQAKAIADEKKQQMERQLDQGLLSLLGDKIKEAAHSGEYSVTYISSGPLRYYVLEQVRKLGYTVEEVDIRGHEVCYSVKWM